MGIKLGLRNEELMICISHRIFGWWNEE